MQNLDREIDSENDEMRSPEMIIGIYVQNEDREYPSLQFRQLCITFYGLKNDKKNHLSFIKSCTGSGETVLLPSEPFLSENYDF